MEKWPRTFIRQVTKENNQQAYEEVPDFTEYQGNAY